MKRSYRRARKPGMKRKRFYKARARTYRRSYGGGYDGALKLKIHAVYDITHSTVYGHADFCTNWAGNGVAASTTTARLTVTPEFTGYVNLYNEYKVVGCKTQIVPISQATGVAGSGIYNMWIGSDSQTLPGNVTSDNQFQSYCDYKVASLARPYKIYHNAAKYYAKRAVKWQPTSVNYPDMGTCFRLYSLGYAAGTVVAKAHVTWYVKFKGPQL